jgi:hypothetical protein
MIIVTGTKRSGTSMWMQVLKAGGIPTVGKEFSGIWKDTIYQANKRGFYESIFRRGIYYQTNPHPTTGSWLSPRGTENLGVKVFIPGVVRTDFSYLTRVIATVRPFRQYVASMDRLLALEREGMAREGKTRARPTPVNPILGWWLENFLLVRDITTRGYPARLVSYEAMLDDPEAICAQTFNWLELGDDQAAARAVHPEERTQAAVEDSTITHAFEDVFDEYHHLIRTGAELKPSFLAKLNEVHQQILPEILDDLKRFRSEAQTLRRKREPDPKKDPLSVDRLDAIFHGLDEHDAIEVEVRKA